MDGCKPLHTGNRTAAVEMEQMKAAAAQAEATGKAVQVDPYRPKSKPYGPKRLKLYCFQLLLSNSTRTAKHWRRCWWGLRDPPPHLRGRRCAVAATAHDHVRPPHRHRHHRH